MLFKSKAFLLNLLFGFFIIFNYSCKQNSSKDGNREQDCLNFLNDDLNFCTEKIYINGKCVNQLKEDGLICSENSVCLSGVCTEVECTSHDQCNDNSNCTLDYCVNNKCSYIDVLTSAGKICKDGKKYSVPSIPCETNEDCPTEAQLDDECFEENQVCQTPRRNYCGFNVKDKFEIDDNYYCSLRAKVKKYPCETNQDCLSMIDPDCDNSSGWVKEYSYCTDKGYCYFSHIYTTQGKNCIKNGINGVCDSGMCFLTYGCLRDADCPEDTFCADNYCDLESNTCKANTNENEGKFCEKDYPPYGLANGTICSSGVCSFDAVKLGLCDEYPLGFNGSSANGEIFPTDTFNNFSINNNGKRVLGLATKFKREGDLICSSTSSTLNGIGIMHQSYGRDSSPVKNGFDYNEEINLFIRTKDYVCRVKVILTNQSQYMTVYKYAGIALYKIGKIVDYSTESEVIDFNNVENCWKVD